MWSARPHREKYGTTVRTAGVRRQAIGAATTQSYVDGRRTASKVMSSAWGVALW